MESFGADTLLPRLYLSLVEPTGNFHPEGYLGNTESVRKLQRQFTRVSIDARILGDGTDIK